MQLKFTDLQTSESVNSAPDAKTHRLTFTSVDPNGPSPSLLGTSQLSLTLTKAEAAEYTLGGTYTLSLTAA